MIHSSLRAPCYDRASRSQTISEWRSRWRPSHLPRGGSDIVLALPNMRLKLSGARVGRIASLASQPFYLPFHSLAPARTSPAA